MSEPKLIRWGIASAGLISHDFTNAIVGVLPSGEHKVVAVAARKLEDAKAFADKHGIGTSYGDYEALAKDSSVDVSISITTATCNFFLLFHIFRLCTSEPLTRVI